MRVEISIRNESGQAIVEYILVLVVSVAIILGGMYQLNSAFKTWANNYFGTYLACLLETGELPTISGTGGDSGLCNQFFKPFSLADGRPLLAQGANKEPAEPKQNSTSTREGRRGGGGSGGGGGTSNSEFSRSKLPGNPENGNKGAGGKRSEATNTGDTRTQNYGSYGSNGSSSRKTRLLLDTNFAFQNERETPTRRQITSVPQRNYTGSAGMKTAVHFHNKSTVDTGDAPESGFTIASFLRYLIIAAIILALVIFLGGQGLQIGKSMD